MEELVSLIGISDVAMDDNDVSRDFVSDLMPRIAA